MGDMLPMGTPGGISWNPASVEAPQVPLLPAGEDTMSATISAVLPTLGVPLTASVAAVSAKENQFSDKVGTAESAYKNADESGGQSVGQLSSMLGQVGQMAQQAGKSAGGGGGGGGFGSLMEQAMKAFQSGGSGSGSQAGESQSGGSQAGAAGSGGQGAGAPTNGGQSQSKDEAAQAQEQEREREREAREHKGSDAEAGDREPRSDQDSAPVDGATPGVDSQGRAPVAVPEQPRSSAEDLARRM